MNVFEKRLKNKINEQVIELSAITPGLVIDVYKGGRHKGLLRMGKTYSYYDLASLTKIIFTASASMRYFSGHPRELRQPVNRILPWWKAPTTPFDLLTHTAGLDWWR